jgi:hypothetical protein
MLIKGKAKALPSKIIFIEEVGEGPDLSRLREPTRGSPTNSLRPFALLGAEITFSIAGFHMDYDLRFP